MCVWKGGLLFELLAGAAGGRGRIYGMIMAKKAYLYSIGCVGLCLRHYTLAPDSASKMWLAQ